MKTDMEDDPRAERTRNQEDPHEQGTRGDQDKMSERESQPDPPNVIRGDQAVGRQPHGRTDDDDRGSQR